MAHIVPFINLVKREREDFLETFLRWALSIGRLVVMLTEIVALSAFLYRFSLDRQLIDLHDKIKQKQTIVNLLKDNENKYRNLQNRLTIASKLTDVSLNVTDLFTGITDLAPAGFFINTMLISENEVRIDANTTSLQPLVVFISNLKSYPKINTVSLDKIENKISTATLGVVISANVKY